MKLDKMYKIEEEITRFSDLLSEARDGMNQPFSYQQKIRIGQLKAAMQTLINKLEANLKD